MSNIKKNRKKNKKSKIDINKVKEYSRRQLSLNRKKQFNFDSEH